VGSGLTAFRDSALFFPSLGKLQGHKSNEESLADGAGDIGSGALMAKSW